MKTMFYGRHRAALLAAALIAVAPLALADVKISALPAGSALAGTEPVPAVQSGVTVKTTPDAISTYTFGQMTSSTILGKFSGTCDATTMLRGNGQCTKVDLATNVAGQLGAANGGTGAATLSGLLKGNGTSPFTAAASSDVISLWTGTCNSTTFLRADGSCQAAGGGSGTVTSVGLTMPSGLSVGGSPVTTSGTLAVTTTLSGVVHGNGSGFTASNVALASEVSGTLPIANGGTNLTAAVDDNVMVGNGTTWQSKGLTDCAGATNAVTYSTATNNFGCNTIAGGGGTPAGSNTQVQFNSSGSFGADSNFTYSNSGTRTITLGSASVNGALKAADVTSGTAPTISILGSTQTSGQGGDVIINAGNTNNSTSTVGPDVKITGGTGGASGGAGGRVVITGGVSNTNGTGGGVELTGGIGKHATVDGDGGPITLLGGSGIRGGTGGLVTISGGRAGASSGATGANLVLNGGRGGSASGNGGVIILQTAAADTLTERLRILNNGAWSVGSTGTATGTAGQVLTSAGSGSAPTWSNSAITSIANKITTTGNSAGSQTTVWTTSLAANTLTADGQTVHFSVAGTVAATSSTDKRFTIEFGDASTSLLDSGAFGTNTGVQGFWQANGMCIRSGATTARCTVTMTAQDAASTTPPGQVKTFTAYASVTATWSGTPTFRVTTNGTNANDTSITMGRIWAMP
jgi:hypothetical protein